MQTVAHLLRAKPDQNVVTISPAATVLDALKLLSDKGIGALLVMDNGQITGVFSERDYTRKIELKGRSAQNTLVRDIMSPSVICVGPAHSNEQCMALMTENRIRHLPVVENGQLVGMISIGDLVKDIISEQQFTIQQLEHYIYGVRS